MMKRFLLLAVMLVVAACATDPGTRHDQKQTGAVVAGAVIGGLIGAQFGGGSGSVALASACGTMLPVPGQPVPNVSTAAPP